MTRDVDFLTTLKNPINSLENIFREIIAIPTEPDGLVFDFATLITEPIKAIERYGGISISQSVLLGKARIQLYTDIAFGDIIKPQPEVSRFPSLLDMAVPVINTYPIYTVIAEKFHAMTVLDLGNSRLKGFL
jgi:hypothetical protein